MRNLAFGLLASTLFSFNAMALPILTESAEGTGLIATIYPDHENPSKFYFSPNTGRLERDSKDVPRFGMSYWSGGGYFSGIFRLGVEKDLRTAVQNYKETGKQISVIPVQRSYVTFAEDKESGARVFEDIFKEVSLPPFSGRLEDSIGISSSLTPMGANMLATMLSSGAQGAELNYCYEITGVSPIFHAKITLNYKKIYSHFVAQASGGRWFWKWSVRTEIEKLIENGDIKIEINGGTANQYDYIMALADRMVEKFMKPVLENRRATTSGRYSVAYIEIKEDREQTFEIKQREIINREHCVALGLGELKEFPWLITKVGE